MEAEYSKFNFNIPLKKSGGQQKVALEEPLKKPNPFSGS